MNYAIIAAGSGSRLAAEGIATPKPLAPLGAGTMVERLIGIFLSCGATSVSVITNPDTPQVGALLRSLRLPVPLSVIERRTPGSMHSFAALADTLPPGPVILTTVDTIFAPGAFSRFAATAAALPTGECLMGVTRLIDDEKPLYVDTDPADMTITAFRDTPSGADRYVSAGVYALPPHALTVLRHCMDSGITRMRDFQRSLLADGLRMHAFDLGPVFDVDHAADLDKARRFAAGDDSANHPTTQQQCQR